MLNFFLGIKQIYEIQLLDGRLIGVAGGLEGVMG